MFIKPFIAILNLRGNSIYVLPSNGLETEILTHPASNDSIIIPDPSLIQLSILYKVSWKDLSSLYLSELITVLVVELK